MQLSTTAAVLVRTLEARARDVLNLQPRPYKVLFELTLDCNSRCGTCAIWKTPASVKKRQLRLDEIEQMFRTLGRDICWLALSGGEITLHTQFPAVIDAAKRHLRNLRLVTFTTNGLSPQKALEFAVCVRNAGFDHFVTISLDGDAETHDRVRGVPGNHALAWETFRLLRRHGIRVHFGLTISDENAGFIEREFRKLRDKIKAITIVHENGIYGHPNPCDDSVIEQSLEVVDANYHVSDAGALLERIYVRLSLAFVRSGRSRNVVPCAVGHTSVHVRPDGTTNLCMFMPEIGNVRSGSSLRALLNSPISKQLLKQIREDRCPHCWMNCYAPHSILYHPIRSVGEIVRDWSRRERRRPVSSGRPGLSARQPNQGTRRTSLPIFKSHVPGERMSAAASGD